MYYITSFTYSISISIMDFYNDFDVNVKLINIILNDLQNREVFEEKMIVLEDSMDNLREIFKNNSEKTMKLFNEILGIIL